MTLCQECQHPISWLYRTLCGPGPCGACRQKAIERQWLERDAEQLHARKLKQQAMKAYLAEKYPETAPRPARQGPAPGPAPSPAEAFRRGVAELLVNLGHKRGEANGLITDAIARHPELRTEQELFQAVYRKPVKPP
jgi:hypothetical protein